MRHFVKHFETFYKIYFLHLFEYVSVMHLEEMLILLFL